MDVTEAIREATWKRFAQAGLICQLAPVQEYKAGASGASGAPGSSTWAAPVEDPDRGPRLLVGSARLYYVQHDGSIGQTASCAGNPAPVEPFPVTARVVYDLLAAGNRPETVRDRAADEIVQSLERETATRLFELLVHPREPAACASLVEALRRALAAASSGPDPMSDPCGCECGQAGDQANSFPPRILFRRSVLSTIVRDAGLCAATDPTTQREELLRGRLAWYQAPGPAPTGSRAGSPVLLQTSAVLLGEVQPEGMIVAIVQPSAIVAGIAEPLKVRSEQASATTQVLTATTRVCLALDCADPDAVQVFTYPPPAPASTPPTA